MISRRVKTLLLIQSLSQRKGVQRVFWSEDEHPVKSPERSRNDFLLKTFGTSHAKCSLCTLAASNRCCKFDHCVRRLNDDRCGNYLQNLENTGEKAMLLCECEYRHDQTHHQRIGCSLGVGLLYRAGNSHNAGVVRAEWKDMSIDTWDQTTVTVSLSIGFYSLQKEVERLVHRGQKQKVVRIRFMP